MTNKVHKIFSSSSSSFFPDVYHTLCLSSTSGYSASKGLYKELKTSQGFSLYAPMAFLKVVKVHELMWNNLLQCPLANNQHKYKYSISRNHHSFRIYSLQI